ncbi:hypothetical protein ACMAY7_14635 [Rhodobacteraceae bacterium nBUS_24]
MDGVLRLKGTNPIYLEYYAQFTSFDAVITSGEAFATDFLDMKVAEKSCLQIASNKIELSL